MLLEEVFLTDDCSVSAPEIEKVSHVCNHLELRTSPHVPPRIQLAEGQNTKRRLQISALGSTQPTPPVHAECTRH